MDRARDASSIVDRFDDGVKRSLHSAREAANGPELGVPLASAIGGDGAALRSLAVRCLEPGFEPSAPIPFAPAARHILKAEEEEGLGRPLAVALGIDGSALRELVERCLEPARQRPGSDGAKQVLERALEEAEAASGAAVVDTRHLLLAVLRDEVAPSAVLLREMGVEYADARKALRRNPEAEEEDGHG